MQMHVEAGVKMARRTRSFRVCLCDRVHEWAGSHQGQPLQTAGMVPVYKVAYIFQNTFKELCLMLGPRENSPFLTFLEWKHRK